MSLSDPIGFRPRDNDSRYASLEAAYDRLQVERDNAVKALASYFKHFGPRAVEAAEQDKLGEAIELLRRATDHIDRAGWTFGLHEAIVSFLATTTKGNA